MQDFNISQFLTENKLTTNSRQMLKEDVEKTIQSNADAGNNETVEGKFARNMSEYIFSDSVIPKGKKISIGSIFMEPDEESKDYYATDEEVRSVYSSLPTTFKVEDNHISGKFDHYFVIQKTGNDEFTLLKSVEGDYGLYDVNDDSTLRDNEKLNEEESPVESKVEVVDTDNRDAFTTELILSNNTRVEVEVIDLFLNMVENLDNDELEAEVEALIAKIKNI